MKITATDVLGVMIVDLEPHSDDRGLFARTFDVEEFRANGMEVSVAQGNLSFNHRAGRSTHGTPTPEPAPNGVILAGSIALTVLTADPSVRWAAVSLHPDDLNRSSIGRSSAQMKPTG